MNIRSPLIFQRAYLQSELQDIFGKGGIQSTLLSIKSQPMENSYHLSEEVLGHFKAGVAVQIINDEEEPPPEPFHIKECPICFELLTELKTSENTAIEKNEGYFIIIYFSSLSQ